MSMSEEEKQKVVDLGRIKFEEAKLHGLVVEDDFDVFIVGFFAGIFLAMHSVVVIDGMENDDLQ